MTFNTLNSGILSNQVQSVAVGPNGDIWVGHWSGGFSTLAHDEWQSYPYSDSTRRMTVIQSIAVRSDSVVWMVHSRGISRVTGPDWSVSDWPDNPSRFSRVVVIEPGGGYVYVGGNGLSLFDGEQWAFAVPPPGGWPAGMMQDLAFDIDRRMWVAFGETVFDGFDPDLSGGVGVRSMGEWTFYTTEDGLPDTLVWSIAPDGNGGVWAGGNSWISHLTDSGWVCYCEDAFPLGLAIVNTIAVDHAGVVWIGGATGLASFDGERWVSYTTANSGLGGNDVRAIAVDADNNKWIGTNAGGVTRLSDGDL
jgi:ligand-binding sensor domain-containing protein